MRAGVRVRLGIGVKVRSTPETETTLDVISRLPRVCSRSCDGVRVAVTARALICRRGHGYAGGVRVAVTARARVRVRVRIRLRLRVGLRLTALICRRGHGYASL